MTLQPDHITAVFQVLAAGFILMSVLLLHESKIVRGVHRTTVLFFALMGCWNVFYFWHLDQPWSTAAGALVAAANVIWLVQIMHYRQLEKRDPGYADRVRRSELMKASKGEY